MPCKTNFLLKNFALKAKFFFVWSFFSCLTTFAQTNNAFSISFPTNRIVFQRNNENVGFVNILGNYTQAIDKIEAKLTPVVAGQGTATDWALVQENVKAGYFAGKIKGEGGWYKLEVRAIKNNTVLQTITIEKVGIGEVFIALGQSNAQGLPNYGAKGATDDRVNAIYYEGGEVYDPLPENLNFVQLSDKVNISPGGDGPWCYGELGDRLVKRLNVPVAFFNEGLLLVSVTNWRESAEGLPTFNFVLDIGGRFQLPKGLPYINLKNTLHYYGALMGIRSLLWIQGETDNSPRRLSADVYSTELQKVIDISRKDFDDNLTWMVARTSLTYLAPSNPEIIGGQNRVINKAGNNVFAGPFTDNLQIPRIDNVHFQNVPGNMGISLLAENWDKSLDDNFFRNSKPILAKTILEPDIICDANNQVNIKLPDGFRYQWSNNATNNRISVGKGIFSVSVKDPRGNKYLVPTINTQDFVYPKEKPVISNSQGLEFCGNGINKVELIANGQEFKSFQWSSGETTNTISVNSTSNFTVKGINYLGCASAESDNVSIKPNPIPAKPQITISPANTVCEGQNITLSIDGNDKILWNNNDTTKTIKVDKIGNYTFSAKVKNSFGCISAASDEALVRIISNPVSPKITVSPANAACEGQNITLLIDSKDKITWSNNDTTKTITINKIGNYEFSAKVTNAVGCVSPISLIQKISVSPTPKQPSIAQIGLFSLQAQNGDFLEKDQFEWKKENTVVATTNVPILKSTQSGNYNVSTVRSYKVLDNQAFTCRSKESVPILFESSNSIISLYPNPAARFIYLETKEAIANLEVKFYTLVGKQVYVLNLDNSPERKEIDLRSLENGLYIIKIKGDGFEESKLIIIESK